MVDDAESESIEETTIKEKPWPTLPPSSITTSPSLSEPSFDINSDTPSDSASLLFLNNPNLIPDDDIEVEHSGDENDSLNISEDSFDDDLPSNVETRNRILQVKSK